MRRLTVSCTDRTNCYVGLHSSDVVSIVAEGGASRHFCHALRLELVREARARVAGLSTTQGAANHFRFVGWAGELACDRGKIEMAHSFADCLGLYDGDEVTVTLARGALVASRVMVQPSSADDWEVVELQASYLEENLLAQVAVINPGLVFPVWVHGKVVARLRVDPRDENISECSLLVQDTELAIESRPREALGGVRAISVLGASKGSCEPSEHRLRLRVLELVADLRAPVARANSRDVEELVGLPLASDVLVWLLPPRRQANESHLGRRITMRDPAGKPHFQPFLVRLDIDDRVSRKHLVLGRSSSLCAGIVRFDLVDLVRCRQVPVCVPRLTLQPLEPISLRDRGAGSGQRGCGAAAILEGQFTDQLAALVRLHSGELYLSDGVIVELEKASQNDLEVGAISEKIELADEKAKQKCEEEINIDELYSGEDDADGVAASDNNYIDDDDASDCLFGKQAIGIEEIDLGLDEGPFVGELGSKVSSVSCIAVRVGLAVGVAWREEESSGEGSVAHGAVAVPFVRVTSQALASGRLAIAVGMIPTAPKGRIDLNAQEKLSRLWAVVPRLGPPPESGWGGGDFLEILGRSEEKAGAFMALGCLSFITNAAAALREQILAQLGCHLPPGAITVAGEGSCVRAASTALATKPVVPVWAAPSATVVVGSPGSGKTTLCRTVCGAMTGDGVLPLFVACARLGHPGRKFQIVLEWIRSIFRFACWYSPSVILFDDFGALCPDVEPGAPALSVSEERSIVVAELFADLLREVRACGAHVAVVASAVSEMTLHRSLWQAEVLEQCVAVKSPQLKERPSILQAFCQQRANEGWHVESSLLQDGSATLDEWGARLEGYSLNDLERLVERACLEAKADIASWPLTTIPGTPASCGRRFVVEHLERAYKGFVPSAMADQNFLSSDIRLEDIGGMEGPKRALMDMLTMSSKYAALIDRAPVKGRRGIMLVGPPGCGKTMLVHAAAAETKGLVRILSVKGPELLSKYIGASEAGVRAIFERAAAAAPSAIFFDEIEALAPKRGADSTGVTDRVVNQMLCYLDGVEDRGCVYVIAATGRPDLVDAALMRPGRFDKICYCGMPDDEEKFQICKIMARTHGVEMEDLAQIRDLVKHIPSLFTPADLQGLFASATILALNQSMKRASDSPVPLAEAQVLTKTNGPTMTHVFSALASARSSISSADEKRYAQIFAPYRSGALASDCSAARVGGWPGDPSSQVSKKRVALA